MEAISRFIDRAKDYSSRHPGRVAVASHVITASVFLYILSEGKPVQYLKKKLFQAAMVAVPQSIIDAELDKVRSDIQQQVVGNSLDGETLVSTLPAAGWDKEKLCAELDKYSAKDEKHWKRGKVSGAVYHGGDDLSAVMGEAFRRFALSNPLHPDLFPSVRKMESEVVAMCLKLFNAPADGVGTMTSGGTESILMAMKAYRDYARTKRGVTEPELVVPVTAHAAFDKACGYFGIKLVHVPVDPATFRADVAAMKKAVTRNTIGLVASAPCFPQGVIDPIEELAAFALEKNLPMHVDCCLGSILIAFASEAGFPTRPFDFRVPGVTSISMDTHKYGFAPKGSSVVMYSRPDLRHAQYFVAPEWTGGIYASPSIAGSRPGALIAACWATMVHIGRDGYTAISRDILTASKKIADGVRAMKDLALYGEPDLSVVCFGVRKGSAVNIYHVSDEMGARGWNLNILQNPACVHIAVTFANCGHADTFVKDLNESVAASLSEPAEKYKSGAGAIYGMAANIPDKSMVAQASYSFLDALYLAAPPGSKVKAIADRT